MGIGIQQPATDASVRCRNCGNLNPVGYVSCHECSVSLVDMPERIMAGRCGINAMLKDQYAIVKNLATGKMNHVDIGFDYATQAYCIIKYPIIIGDPDDHTRIRRLMQEANIVSMLAHPNIVRFNDAFWQGNLFYLVLEYVDGNPLSAIRANRDPSVDEILKWTGTLSKTLWHIHNQGMIFNNLRPSNVMLDRDKKIVLIDFGGAQLNVAAETPGASETTLASSYTAPEMLTSGKADARSDVFSLGATVYFLVTGNKPAKVTRDMPAVQFEHEHQKISYLVQKAMFFDPESRFGSMLEVSAFLEGKGKPSSWKTPSKFKVTHKEGNPRLKLLSEGTVRTYRIFPITKVVLTIGRTPEVDAPVFYRPDITVWDQDVSLKPKKQYNPWGHGRVVTEYDPSAMKYEYYFEDLDSMNGTYLNGSAINQKTRLKNGDIIRLGPHTTFKFRIDSA
jgi:serine/threonine protein kinase